MKGLKTILAIALSATGLGSAVAFGVGALDSVREIIPAQAEVTSKSLIVKFGSLGNWTEANAKLAVYLWKGSGSSKVETWTNVVSLDTNKKIYKLDYSFDGTPENLIVTRQNSSASSASWDTKWAQSSDLSFNEATYLNLDGWNITSTSGWTLSAQVRSNKVTSFGTKETLSTIGLNGSNNPEVSGAVTLEEDEEFKILSGDNVWSGYYGCPEAIDSCFSGGSKTARSDSNPNIVCEVAGTYDFFFDTETKRVWLTRQDIVDADGFASYFLSNVGCDETGATSPSGWSTCASTYNNLNGAARDVLCSAAADKDGDNIARCVYWYDYAVAAHPSLTKFMVDSSSNPRVASSNSTSYVVNNNNAVLIVAIVAAISLSATGVFFLLRKKRKEQ